METETTAAEAGQEELIGGAEILNPAAAPEGGATEEGGTPAANPITIDGKEFSSREEAFAYAEEQLAQERLAGDAYRQGIQDASSAAPAAAPAAAAAAQQEDNFDEQFYNNPKAYLEKMRKDIRDEVKSEVSTEQSQTQQREKVWTEFFTKNPDLSNFRGDCEAVLYERENWETIGQMKDTGKAMELLAGRVRAKFKKISESQLPQKELANTSAGVTPGGQMQVTTKETAKKPMDFQSQLQEDQKRKGLF